MAPVRAESEYYVAADEWRRRYFRGSLMDDARDRLVVVINFGIKLL